MIVKQVERWGESAEEDLPPPSPFPMPPPPEGNRPVLGVTMVYSRRSKGPTVIKVFAHTSAKLAQSACVGVGVRDVGMERRGGEGGTGGGKGGGYMV